MSIFYDLYLLIDNANLEAGLKVLVPLDCPNKTNPYDDFYYLKNNSLSEALTRLDRIAEVNFAEPHHDDMSTDDFIKCNLCQGDKQLSFFITPWLKNIVSAKDAFERSVLRVNLSLAKNQGFIPENYNDLALLLNFIRTVQPAYGWLDEGGSIGLKSYSAEDAEPQRWTIGDELTIGGTTIIGSPYLELIEATLKQVKKDLHVCQALTPDLYFITMPGEHYESAMTWTPGSRAREVHIEAIEKLSLAFKSM